MAHGDYSARYRNYVLFVLFLTYVLNFLDRQLMTILLEPIKQEFDASDTAMGFLTGFAFALFYATLGIPVARLAASVWATAPDVPFLAIPGRAAIEVRNASEDGASGP